LPFAGIYFIYLVLLVGDISMIQNRKERRILALKIRKGKKYSISKIKYNLDYISIKRLIEIIPKSALNALFSNPLPRKITDIDQATTYFINGMLLKEIDWCFLRILKYNEEINHFLKLRDSFETQLLFGNYDKCESLLNEIEIDICISYWGLQAKMVLAELNAGTEGNRMLLKSYQKQAISPNLKIMLYYNSLKLETDIPSNKYDSYIDFHLKKHSSDYSKMLADYVTFKFSPFRFESNFSFDFILHQDFSLSVIDTYIELKKILSILISANDETIAEEYIIDRIPDIALLIDDNFWKKTLDLYSKNSDITDFGDIEFKIALKNLADNEINECLEFTSKELLNKPNSYNLYQIFVEALSFTDRKIEDYLEDGSILYLILSSLYQVIRKEQNHSENIEDISKLAYIFDICDFHLPLISLCYSEKFPNVPESLRNYNYLLNRSYSLHDAIHFEKGKGFDYLNEKKLFIGQKLQIDYFIQKNDYKNSLHLLNVFNDYNEYFKNIYYETWYNRKKLHCFIELERFTEAAELVDNYYFKHQRIFTSLYSQRLVDKIIELDGESIFKSLYIPILFTIYNLSSSIVYDAIANFLIQNNISSVREVRSSYNIDNIEMLCFFLQKVCTINNIQDSPYLRTIEIVEKERINVLTQLKELKPELSREVNVEIFDITQKATVRYCLQNIYDSRIYVDTNGVKKVISKDIGDYFERYINITDFSFQDYSIFTFNKGQEDETYSKLLTYIGYFKPPISLKEYEILTILSEQNVELIHPNKVEVPYSRYIAFQDIFEIIKNQFLFDEDYGLKFFLSMRIRHGTLPNFLKNVFDKHTLVINEGINKVKIIDYWKEKIFDIDKSFLNTSFIKALELFTSEIENITSEGVSWVKIKESEHDRQSMFDISLTEHDLFYNFRNRLGHIEDFDTFIEEVFEILWIKINEVLFKLRTRFTNELLTKYISSIDMLHNEVDTIFGEGNFVFFNDVLVSTKTDIQNAIQKSLNWFNISKTKSIGEIPISAIIQTSKAYLNILNANVFENRINCVEKIFFKQNIKGEYFILFCDFFNTILGNVIKHTEETNKPKCEISITGNEYGGLTINVNNNTAQKYSKNLIEVWNKLLNDNNGNYDASFEGKSGFLKIKKLFTGDKVFQDYLFQLNSEENIFTFKVVFKQKYFAV